MAGRKKIVCISGMERSGTSMTARIVNLLGVYLGERDDLIMETDYNQKGCWENKTLLEISDAILARFGGSTHMRPDFAEGWTSDPKISDLEEQARGIIEKEFSGRDAWGWKDTRCCLTMPFWQRLLPDMEYVICVRNPVDVAKSLVTRKWAASFPEAYYIWYMYTSGIIRHTGGGKRRIFAFYEDFMGKDWREAVRRLAAFLGPEYLDNMRTAGPEIEAFITKGLQHHETSILEAMEEPGMPLSIKAYYLALCLLGKEEGPLALKGLDARAAQVIDAISMHEDRGARDELIITKLQKELEDRQSQIEALLNSASWKVTAPLRRLADTFKK